MTLSDPALDGHPRESMPVQLTQVVPWGRSFDEYVAMFGLGEADLNRSILDVAAGPASFNASMHRIGRRVVSVDPIYAFTPEQIRERVTDTRQTMMDQVRRDMGHFVWNFIKSPEMLEQVRMDAMETFLADLPAGLREGRYLARECPRLGLEGQRFDLALCSHFLFLYSEQLSEEFHIETIRELKSLSDEVRIFPLLDLNGQGSRHLPAVQKQFGGEIVPVSYEFLRGANEMLVIR